MYLDFKVKIPDSFQGITRKNIKGAFIGKSIEGDSNMMYPNANFVKFFPNAELPDDISKKQK